MKSLIPFMLLASAVLASCSKSNNATANVPEPAPNQDSAGVTIPDTTHLPGQVPAHVLSKFNYYFPSEKKVEWGTEGANYKATFKADQGDKSVLFSAEGDILSSKTQINRNSLPEAMLAYLSSKLHGKKLGKASMSASETGNITYEIEVEGMEYIFDGSGNFLRIDEKE